MRDASTRRLFFGAEVEAPWVDKEPAARLIPQESRHITLAFLGSVPPAQVIPHIDSMPPPPFSIGPAGWGKELLFLPSQRSRVVALDVEWLSQGSEFLLYQQLLSKWLEKLGYPADSRPFHPHISLARRPFDPEEWKEHFSPLPFFIKAIHLYQSHSHLEYKAVWDWPLLKPFEEIEHTADIAFLVRGMDVKQLYNHAQLALAFKFPSFLLYPISVQPSSLDEIVMALNQWISLTDRLCGCPMKAVSFHGSIQSDVNGVLNWEMIIDV